MNPNCLGIVPGLFSVCGEVPGYAYCSDECAVAAQIQALPCKGDAVDYTFITDRLAVGNVASRQVPGFCAVVSLLATAPWDEWTEAPQVLNSITRRSDVLDTYSRILLHHPPSEKIPVLHVDVQDGSDRLLCHLDDATSFIAAHLSRGCVLIHCGAGISRSGAVAVAYFCRYAGMSYSEALAFVKSRRPCVAPADCFAAAIKRWLRLDDLAATGPRR